MNETRFLVAGATGMSGNHVARLLVKRRHAVRVLAHRKDDRSRALENLGAEVVYGDLRSMKDARAALAGISGAYFVFPLSASLVQATATFAQAAWEAGVEIIVNMSQLAARPEAESPAALNHWLSERVFDWCGVAVTHLRATFFAEWLLYVAPAIRSGHVAMPWPADSRYSPIATPDLAQVTMAILENPRDHGGNTYTLHGPVQYACKNLANVVGRVLDKPIRYEEITCEALAESIGQGHNTYFKEHCKAIVVDLRNGVFAGRNDLLEELTGQRPTTLPEFVNRHRQAFA